MTSVVGRHTHVDDDVCCPVPGDELMAKERAEDLAEIFKALADPTRVRLLEYLAGAQGGTACACHLPPVLGISQPTLSHHIGKLHRAGLVERDRRGRWVHYTVRPEALEGARAFLALSPAKADARSC